MGLRPSRAPLGLMLLLGCVLALSVLSLSPRLAFAVKPHPAEDANGATAPIPLASPKPSLSPKRLEWSALPALAGTTDDGVVFGGFFVLAKYREGYEPYRWRSENVAFASVKNGPHGADFPTQVLQTNLDLPGLFGGRLRLSPMLRVVRLTGQSFFGVGNDSRATRTGPEETTEAAAEGDPARYFQYRNWSAKASVTGRTPLLDDLHLRLAVELRYGEVSPYPGSLLAASQAVEAEDGKGIYGVEPLSSVLVAVGLLWDSRDHETVPERGGLYEVSLRASKGLPSSTDVAYMACTVDLRRYIPFVPGRLSLATRLLVDEILGNAPFYELTRAGAFSPLAAPGGLRAIRGVPDGRYAGKVKVVAGMELRSWLWRFSAGEHRFRLGATAFGDAGRVWSDLPADPSLDGSGLGLKFGVGGGPRLQWGESVVIRVDLAWSPDASATNPNVPLGIYFALGAGY